MIYKQNRRSATFRPVSNETGDLTLIVHKKRTIYNIIRNIERDVSNEKVFLYRYITKLDKILELDKFLYDIDFI